MIDMKLTFMSFETVDYFTNINKCFSGMNDTFLVNFFMRNSIFDKVFLKQYRPLNV